MLTVDGVVQEAITEANTVAGKEARKLCEEAGKKRMEELRGLEGEDGDKKMGGLSMEALTAHTQGAPGKYNNLMFVGKCLLCVKFSVLR